MLTRTSSRLIAIVFAGQVASQAAELRLMGAIEGKVNNGSGVGQMGAVVHLMNRNDRPLQRVITDSEGRFRFDALFPDQYNVRVTLSSFLPAYRSNVLVKAGLDSFLNVQLANIFSSIQLTYRPPGQSGLLTEDWKYVLRGSISTRPVLRFTPTWEPGISVSDDPSHSVFSDTRGLLRVSAGDQAASSGLGHEADLGTAFALATSVFGRNEFQVAGNVGYASSQGTSGAGFRTRYSRTGGTFSAPDVELTVRQTALRTRVGGAMIAGAASGQTTPMLRTMSVKVEESVPITDNLQLEYGGMLESVAFIDRLNVLSPYARVTYDDRDYGTLMLAYSSGAPATSLLYREGGAPALESLSGLAMFPRVSIVDGHARVQGTDTLEMGYTRKFGANGFGAAYYVENVRDLAMALAGASGYVGDGNLLPDMASDATVFNLGSFRASGFTVSAQRTINENLTASVRWGNGGTLEPIENGMIMESPADLRTRFRPVRQQWASARVAGNIARSGTNWSASYGWSRAGSLAANHAFLTQRYLPLVGVNFHVRQSLPAMGMPGRLEMNAEIRNLLAQGYVPISTATGGRVILMQFPRTVRGGFSFIF